MNKFVFQALRIVVWIIFVGLSIEAGGLLVNFFFSLYRPELIPRLYQKLDLSEIHRQDPAAFFSLYIMILLIAVLKSTLFYLVVQLVTKMDLRQPFSSEIAKKILQISYFTFAIGLISYIGSVSAKNLSGRSYSLEPLQPFWADSQAFILMAMIVYIIAAIFNRESIFNVKMN